MAVLDCPEHMILPGPRFSFISSNERFTPPRGQFAGFFCGFEPNEYAIANPTLEWRSDTVRRSRSESFLSELPDYFDRMLFGISAL